MANLDLIETLAGVVMDAEKIRLNAEDNQNISNLTSWIIREGSDITEDQSIVILAIIKGVDPTYTYEYINDTLADVTTLVTYLDPASEEFSR